MKKYSRIFFLITFLSTLLYIVASAITFSFFNQDNLGFIMILSKISIYCLILLVYIVIVGWITSRHYSKPVDSSDEQVFVAELKKTGSRPLRMLELFILGGLVITFLLSRTSGNGALSSDKSLLMFVLTSSFSWNLLFGAVIFITGDRLNVRYLINQNLEKYPMELREYRQSRKMFIIPTFTTLMGVFYTLGITGGLMQTYKSINQIPASAFVVAIICLVVYIVTILVLEKISSNNSRMVFESVITQFEQLSTGNKDLTRKVLIGSIDEPATISGMFNMFTENLADNIRIIKSTQDTLHASSLVLQKNVTDSKGDVTRISGGIETMQSQSEDQTRSLEMTISAVEQVASAIDNLNKVIETQASSITEASASVEEMVGNINSINNTMGVMGTRFGKLSEDASEGTVIQDTAYEKITDIVKKSEDLQVANQVIASISSQTNLLAMNAAIEAAHAGEAGRGFAVVADEIRKLAEDSSKNSNTISRILSEVQNGIEAVVEASRSSKNTFSLVAQQINDTDKLVKEISLTLDEQKTGASEILTALAQMNDVTATVQTGASEMSAGNETILKESSRLKEHNAVINSSINNIVDGIHSLSKGFDFVASAVEETRLAVDSIGSAIGGFKVD